MNYEADLDDLRDDAERKALESAIEMLESETTPATARASVIRAILGDAATRRHDSSNDDFDPSKMTGSELAKALDQLRRARDRALAVDAETTDAIALPRPPVFD